jgi:hypothetical protein
MAACGLRTAGTPQPKIERLPVLLVAEKNALAARDLAAAGEALSQRIGHPVRVAMAPVIDERGMRARLDRTYDRLPAGGWAGPRCALGRAAAEALAHDANAHYRLVPPRPDAAGALVATPFGESFAPLRLRLDPTSDLRAGFARDIAALSPPPYPLWDTLARRVLREGCALAALAIYDGRLRYRDGSRDVLAAALGRRPATATGAPVAVVEPADAAGDDAAGAEPEAHSCRALCELHMVELCNNDRGLWSRHSQPWRASPCGRMRPEQFLRTCYQQQWLTGTLENACVAPCEATSGGRTRLLQLLRSEGCVRVPAS